MAPEAVPAAGSVRVLAFRRLDQIILGEIERARPRIKRLRKRYPEAPERELAQRLVDGKKAWAGTGGMITGIFGLIAVPADLVLVTYLQISLIVDLALLYRVNLKSQRAQQEVLEILGRGNGVGPILRTGPPLLGRVVLTIVRRRGIPLLGRAVPLVAVPIAAWLNNRDIQHVGDEALRHYSTLKSLAAKRKQST